MGDRRALAKESWSGWGEVPDSASLLSDVQEILVSELRLGIRGKGVQGRDHQVQKLGGERSSIRSFDRQVVIMPGPVLETGHTEETQTGVVPCLTVREADMAIRQWRERTEFLNEWYDFESGIQGTRLAWGQGGGRMGGIWEGFSKEVMSEPRPEG